MSQQKLNEFSNLSIRKIAKEIVIRRYVLILHFWVYIFVNTLLFLINSWTTTISKYPWFLWPLSSWTMVLTVHSCTYLMFRKGIINLNKVFMLYHLIFYIVINSFLVIADLITPFPISETPINWAYWPIGTWGFLLIVHLVVYFYVVPKRGESLNKSWLNRKINEELERIKKNEVGNK